MINMSLSFEIAAIIGIVSSLIVLEIICFGFIFSIKSHPKSNDQNQSTTEKESDSALLHE